MNNRPGVSRGGFFWIAKAQAFAFLRRSRTESGTHVPQSTWIAKAQAFAFLRRSRTESGTYVPQSTWIAKAQAFAFLRRLCAESGTHVPQSTWIAKAQAFAFLRRSRAESGTYVPQSTWIAKALAFALFLPYFVPVFSGPRFLNRYSPSLPGATMSSLPFPSMSTAWKKMPVPECPGTLPWSITHFVNDSPFHLK